jgi:hypothetical protein
MILTEEQIDFIELDLKLRGVALEELRYSMLDHLCCQIEANDSTEFDKAYDMALLEFGKGEMLKVQEDIIKYEFNRTWKRRNFVTYLFGFVSVFLILTGSLFKMMHWPGASLGLILGVFLLNIGFLPLFFYYKYKKSVLGFK